MKLATDRVYRRSTEMALAVHESDMAFLTTGEFKGLDFAAFAMNYAVFLNEIARSVLDASAQYELYKLSLGLLHVDLSKSSLREKYARQILRIRNQLILSESINLNDDANMVEETKVFKRIALSILSLPSNTLTPFSVVKVNEKETKQLIKVLVSACPKRFYGSGAVACFQDGLKAQSKSIKRLFYGCDRANSNHDILVCYEYISNKLINSSRTTWRDVTVSVCDKLSHNSSKKRCMRTYCSGMNFDQRDALLFACDDSKDSNEFQCLVNGLKDL